MCDWEHWTWIQFPAPIWEPQLPVTPVSEDVAPLHRYTHAGKASMHIKNVLGNLVMRSRMAGVVTHTCHPSYASTLHCDSAVSRELIPFGPVYAVSVLSAQHRWGKYIHIQAISINEFSINVVFWFMFLLFSFPSSLLLCPSPLPPFFYLFLLRDLEASHGYQLPLGISTWYIYIYSL